MNEAVTDPWMSNPPETAIVFAGHVTVNCLSPDVLPPPTVMTPLMPAPPLSPFYARTHLDLVGAPLPLVVAKAIRQGIIP